MAESGWKCSDLVRDGSGFDPLGGATCTLEKGLQRMTANTDNADRQRAKVGRRRKLVFGPHNTWLEKRRDGASPCWMVSWYDPTVRSVRYRSTRTEVLAKAKAVLAVFQLPENAITLPPRPQPKFSSVYFIGGDTGAIKIGFAKNVMTRLAALQANSPIPLRVLVSGPGTLKDERIYHARFAAHRLHGEWFERHPDILAEIDRLSPTPSQGNDDGR